MPASDKFKITTAFPIPEGDYVFEINQRIVFSVQIGNHISVPTPEARKRFIRTANKMRITRFLCAKEGYRIWRVA